MLLVTEGQTILNVFVDAVLFISFNGNILWVWHSFFISLAHVRKRESFTNGSNLEFLKGTADNFILRLIYSLHFISHA
jgi:hypothetical protein